MTAPTQITSSPLITRLSPSTTAAASSTVSGAGAVTPENYKFLQDEIYRSSGIVIDADKHYLLEARLTPVLRKAGLANLNELCAKLRARTSSDLGRQVMEALTTNETLFFRDMAPFEAMQTSILPEFQRTLAPSETLRIWSAAASSGQEAYSIAMLLSEMPGSARTAKILGTDISEQILAIAREARYVQFEVNRGLPAQMLVKYFARDGNDWRLKDEIRRMVSFRQFDLRQPMAGLGRFHIIFCRNVLIYFDPETKAKILAQLWMALERGGYLVLGAAESVMNMQDKLERIPVSGSALYRKK